MRSLSKFSRKAQVQSIAPSIIALLIAGVFLVLGIIIIQNIRDNSMIDGGAGSTLRNDTAYQKTNATLIGLGTFGDFWEIIVLAIVISVVIGLLLVVFGGKGAR